MNWNRIVTIAQIINASIGSLEQIAGDVVYRMQTPVLNAWVSWSDRSMDVRFESDTPGIGHGEFKTAAEIGCPGPHGQNHPYDLDIPTLVCPKTDVKKLDHGTFNTGVNGRDALRTTKANLANFLTSAGSFAEHPSAPADVKILIKNLFKKNLSPDELCVSILNQINKLCQRLHDYRAQLVNESKHVKIYDVFTGAQRDEITYKVYLTAHAAEKSQSEIEAIIGEDYNRARVIVEHLNNPYVLNPSMLRSELDELPKKVFTGYTIIFVEKTKGYYVMSDPEIKVKFERITKGSPRFRVKLQAS